MAQFFTLEAVVFCMHNWLGVWDGLDPNQAWSILGTHHIFVLIKQNKEWQSERELQKFYVPSTLYRGPVLQFKKPALKK